MAKKLNGTVIVTYCCNAKCSVFTSTLESFGLVIIEAISAGTPVVISNNLMFDLNKGFYMYNNEEEFLSILDKILQGENLNLQTAVRLLKNIAGMRLQKNSLNFLKSCLNKIYLSDIYF